MAAVAVVCALHVHCAPGEASMSAFPDAEKMMSEASPPRADERGGFVFDTHRRTMSARVDASSAIDIDAGGSHARVERLGVTAGARRRGNVVRSSGDTERFVFARGEEIEELALVSASTTPLAYRLALPDRFRARALSTTLVQIDDPAGEPWLRMRADRAWSADGREVAVSLKLDGDVVRVEVPSDASYPLLVDPSWSTGTSPSKPRSDFHTATLLGDGRVLVAGGASSIATSDTAELYDPRTGIFTALEPTRMKSARRGHTATMLANGKVLLVGGNLSGVNDAEIFDPKTSTFTALTSKPTVARKRHSAVRLTDGKVLIKGGEDIGTATEIFDPSSETFTATNGGTVTGPGAMVVLANGRALFVGTTSAEVFDPQTSTWSATTGLAGQPFGDKDERVAALLRDGRVVVTRTMNCFSTGGPSNCPTWAQLFDPTSSTFGAESQQFPALAGGTTAIVLPSGKVLMAGGAESTTSSQLYDASTNSATLDDADAMLALHRRQTATMLPGGDVLIIGGDQLVADVRTWQGSFTQTNGPMTASREDAVAQRLRNGQVLIAGGWGGDFLVNKYASAELYDPALRTFSATGSMTTQRYDAAVAMLPSGKVLVAGGNDGTSITAKADVYDPETKQWKAVGSMSSPRVHHAVAILPGGKILVAGGCPKIEGCLDTDPAVTKSRMKTAEVFDPVTETFSPTGAMSVERAQHGLVTLPDGKVLVVAGVGEAGQRVELYDPKKGAFEGLDDLQSERWGPSAQLLSSGKVFVSGGPAITNQVFDPTSRTWTNVPGIAIAPREPQWTQTQGGHQMFLAGALNASSQGANAKSIVLELLASSNAAFTPPDPTSLGWRRSVSTALVDHGVFVTGGDRGGGGVPPIPLDTAYVYSDGASDSVRPVLSTVPTKIAGGAEFTIGGQRFTAATGETLLAFWQPAGTNTVLPTRITEFTDTNAKWTAPATALYGNGWLHVVTNGLASNSLFVEVEPAIGGVQCRHDAECASGFCTEGVCCDARCDGACQSCTTRRKLSGEDGTCGSAKPGKDPDNKCFAPQGGECNKPEECATGFCAQGVCCETACDDQRLSCALPNARGLCRALDPCDGDHTLKKIGADGGTDDIDCAPFKCSAAQCRNECVSADDCVSPAVCTFDGVCVLPPAVQPGEESLFGCALSPSRPTAPRTWPALAVLFVLVACRSLRRSVGYRR